MYILALETTGPRGSVAVIDEKGKTIEKISVEEMNHLKELMPMAKEIMNQLGISGNDLSAVAASAGPGSFTGIRIGVSTARAIGQALDIPCIKVPTLELFKEFCDGTDPVAVIFNARRGQVYGAVFDENGNDILKPGPYMLTDVIEKIEENNLEPVFYGDGVDAYGEQIEKYRKALKENLYQKAETVAKVALRMYGEEKTCTYEELLPDYMREVEANQKLKDGTLAKERAAKLERLRNS